MVAVHELVHGSAHMFLSSFVKKEMYIDLLKKQVIDDINMITSNEFNEMISAIGELGTGNGSKYGVFTDDHFRLLEKDIMDGFSGNYAELCSLLLLSPQLISEAITAIRIRSPEIRLSQLLPLLLAELVEEKALDREFTRRGLMRFLPRIRF